MDWVAHPSPVSSPAAGARSYRSQVGLSGRIVGTDAYPAQAKPVFFSDLILERIEGDASKGLGVVECQWVVEEAQLSHYKEEPDRTDSWIGGQQGNGEVTVCGGQWPLESLFGIDV